MVLARPCLRVLINRAGNNGDRKSQVKLTRSMATARTMLPHAWIVKAYAGKIKDGKVGRSWGGILINEGAF